VYLATGNNNGAGDKALFFVYEDMISIYDVMDIDRDARVLSLHGENMHYEKVGDILNIFSIYR